MNSVPSWLDDAFKRRRDYWLTPAKEDGASLDEIGVSVKSPAFGVMSRRPNRWVRRNRHCRRSRYP